jgi:hypothetical protein
MNRTDSALHTRAFGTYLLGGLFTLQKILYGDGILHVNMFHYFKIPYFTWVEESLSITTGRCDLAIATHARKMHKNLFVVVHPEVLDNN